MLRSTVLQVYRRFRQGLFVMASAGVLAIAPGRANAPATPVLPLTVCEVLRDLPAQTGKTVAVLGRYSSREKGSWVSEDTCDAAADAKPQTPPPELWMIEDHNAPRL